MAADLADVLIAGAGPDSLLLAGDLAAAGLDVTVLDGTVLDGSEPRAVAEPPLAIHARSLELLDARGLADGLIAAGQQAVQVSAAGSVTVDVSQLPSRFPLVLLIPADQARLLLARRALAAGARIAGAEIGEVRQHADGVSVLARTAGQARRLLTAPYLAGFGDGGSAIRSRLRLPAPACRSGRVFLGGDAAHGGLSVDVGLQDAANLGWKLAAALRGTAGPRLLGTYQAEREPVSRRMLALDRALRHPALAGPGPLRRAMIAAAGTALRAGPVAGLAARAISGIAVGYPAGRGAHRLAGHRAPDWRLRAGPPDRLYEALRDARPVLLASAALLAAADVAALLALWPGRVLAAEPVSAPAALILVRPDGYIGWAADAAAPVRRYAGLRLALATWCGPPAGRPLAANPGSGQVTP